MFSIFLTVILFFCLLYFIFPENATRRR